MLCVETHLVAAARTDRQRADEPLRTPEVVAPRAMFQLIVVIVAFSARSTPSTSEGEGAPVPAHTPPVQTSLSVHTFPSLQPVPSVFAGFVHPLPGTQVPTSWAGIARDAGHRTAALAVLRFWHPSFSVQTLPSLPRRAVGRRRVRADARPRRARPGLMAGVGAACTAWGSSPGRSPTSGGRSACRRFRRCSPSRRGRSGWSRRPFPDCTRRLGGRR